MDLWYSASNKNEYQVSSLGNKGGRCVGLTALPPTCADFQKSWGPQPPGSLRQTITAYFWVQYYR